MRKSYVYKITCKINGEFYFGSSFYAKRDRYWGSGKKIKERISKYGKENFIKEILGEFDDRTESHRVENQYIEQFRHDDKCLNKRLDYHFEIYSDESRAKMSVVKRGEKNPWYGKHRTEETRAKLSASHRGEKNPMYGKILSEETREKMSVARRGEKNHNFGKHLSAETRAKISAALRGKNLSKETIAKLSAAHIGKPHPHGKHWRKNPVTGKREYYD